MNNAGHEERDLSMPRGRTSMLSAVILAGGRGTRLDPVSGGLPKPLVSVGGTPIVEHQIAVLARYGVGQVFLTTGYGANILERSLGDGSRWGVELHYVRESRPLGTAGGVAALRGRLRHDFFVVYGDVMFDMDLTRLAAFHSRVGADATLVVHPNDHPQDSDLLVLDESDRLLELHPKPRSPGAIDLPNLVSAALYVLTPGALEFVEPGVSQDFIRDVFPRMIASGSRLFGYRTPEYLKDMGTPERLARVHQDCLAGTIASRRWDKPRPTVFLDRDGVINEEIGGVHRADDLRLIEGVGSAINELNRSGWLCAVATNQPGLAKGFMNEETLGKIHRRLESRLGLERSWIDAMVYCPHHPERGHEGEVRELKVVCSCRKPAVGMLRELANQLPVDLSRSVMVGDSWRDMVAGHVFGLETIGVRTGDALRSPPPQDLAWLAHADLLVDDLPAAVKALLAPQADFSHHIGIVQKALVSAARRPLRVAVRAGPRPEQNLHLFNLQRSIRRNGITVSRVLAQDASAVGKVFSQRGHYPLPAGSGLPRPEVLLLAAPGRHGGDLELNLV